MSGRFGEKVKQLRVSRKLLQRQLASLLDIDTPLLSKIERGERTAKKEVVGRLSQILKADEKELLTFWLADQIFEVAKNEDVALKAMQVAGKNIRYQIRPNRK